MISRVRYAQVTFRDAGECLLAIRRRLEDGWWLSNVESEGRGSFVATFGIEDGPLRIVKGN